MIAPTLVPTTAAYGLRTGSPIPDIAGLLVNITHQRAAHEEKVPKEFREFHRVE
jgi:hypothetical protein